MSVDSYSYAFRALGNPIRRDILALLRRGPKSVVEITAEVADKGWWCSRSATSQHLQMLLKAEQVYCKAKGSRNLYQLRRDTVDLLRDYLLELLQLPAVD
jgi:DNA-binding transcriptional ArsR family regulator